jgi:transcriptional regulator with XRE-family HTH domain
LTQRWLADTLDLHPSQIRRWEIGEVRPAFEMIRRLAKTLDVTADELLFDEDERAPTDDLRIQFAATERLNSHERDVIRELIESVIVRHDLEASKDHKGPGRTPRRPRH